MWMKKYARRRLSVLLSLTGISVVSACADTDFKGSTRQELPTVERSFQQLNYPEAIARFTQGHTGDVQDEDFEQGEWGALDLLVVVDNSGSMQEEQANLSSKMTPLLSHIEKSDWQIAVVTTDPDDGCQSMKLIKKDDPQANAKFVAAIKAGTNGSGYEQGIRQAVEGLRCGTGFFGGGDSWVREESTLAILIVSDEDNCHIDLASGYTCEGQPHRYGEYLTDYLASIRDVGTDARAYGLIRHPDDDECDTAMKAGHEYLKVVDATGGKWGSICDSDYTETLTQISEDVAQILKYEFELSHVPDAGSLKITVDGGAWDKFTLNDRLVVFSEPPPFGSKVQVAYRHGAAGDLLTDFDLEKPAANDEFAVSVDGEEIPSGSFTFDVEDNQLEFSSAPKERAEIQISYREKIELLTEFDIGKTAEAHTLLVKVDGVRLTSGWTYDQARGALVFRDAPPAGAEVLVTFKERKR